MYGGLTGKSGDDFRKDEDDPSNKPFIPFTNICNNTYIKGSDLKLVSINEDDNQNRVEKDDIFFMMTSETQEDVGKTSVLKEDLGEVYLNTFCKGFRITDRSVNPYFLNYLLNGKPYRELLSVEGNGFTRINLRQDRVNDLILFTPSITEQEQIVKYLDEKTSQIDQLISITEKKIEGLKEKRTSLINHVVTKGLDSNVEMKDSGVEWIGKIPKHWDIKKMKYCLRLISEKGETNVTDIKISPENVEVNTGVCFNLYSEYTGEGMKFQKGDILLNKLRIYLKKIIITEYDGFSMGEMIVLRTLNGINKYYYYTLFNQGLIDLLNEQSNGVKLPRVSPEIILNSEIVSPPLSEQKQIVEFIDIHTSEIDKLVLIEQQRIETLKEYRQSLISEVVTGKIRVCEESPILME
jgi:type I restriction enzyme S subunit